MENLEAIRETTSYKCPQCGAELIKMEWMRSPYYTNNDGIVVYDSVWIVFCPNCPSKKNTFKIREGTYRMPEHAK